MYFHLSNIARCCIPFISRGLGLGVPLPISNHVDELDVGVGDAPPTSLMDSTSSPKVKTTGREGVGVRSLAHNILGVEGCVRALRWD